MLLVNHILPLLGVGGLFSSLCVSRCVDWW